MEKEEGATSENREEMRKYAEICRRTRKDEK